MTPVAVSKLGPVSPSMAENMHANHGPMQDFHLAAVMRALGHCKIIGSDTSLPPSGPDAYTVTYMMA